MQQTEQFCGYCGLFIPKPVLSVDYPDGAKHFCCEGCMDAYALLHGQENYQESLIPENVTCERLWGVLDRIFGSRSLNT